VDLRLCDPRAISLPNMMKAKKATIITLALGELAGDRAARFRITGCATPPARAGGVRVDGLTQLLEHLRGLPALGAGA
jgi:electron transfer flavoprotein beta subunit